ncbi:hypothetical protein KM799_07295 [Clostridium tyrobutyricum]|uniref:hypothetical protein n=1 Tax=Clostridium tyrobutyricum TaxID=1519 RepID=UPI001C390771|nr:hypothetical protein [Clostridium tyrobutyricum]MBV4446407.1 hypothetical protein [Clostridium tyrobutyricum]
MCDIRKCSCVYNREIRNIAISKRKFNIDAFANIDRKKLEFGTRERRLRLYKTQLGEKIYIQYPGKETKSANIRPWDFRPKLKLKDGSYMRDLSFADIWDDLYRIGEHNNKALGVLATVFFRMAYMIDTRLVECQYSYQDIYTNGNLYNDVDEIYDESEYLKWYSYNPNADMMNYLNDKIGNIRGVSIEAYLYYNDLLAQNEDCKYFYRDCHDNHIKWNPNIGRLNTFLTHISVIGFLKKDLSFSQIMTKFQNGRGIAPVLIREIYDITNGLVRTI